MKPFYRIIRALFKGLFWVLYRQKVFGLEHFIRGRALIASNHASFFDPPFIGVAAPEEITFLARKTLFRFPIFSYLISHLNAYPIAGGTGQDLSSFKLIQDLLKTDHKILIFPEGGRAWSEEVGPMKSGIGMLALRNMCPIIPVYIHGAYHVWNRNKKFPKLFGQVSCIFGSPIYCEPFLSMPKKEAQEAITEKTRESIKNLKHWYKAGAKGSPP
jgi:1-acyl-sn-glycerol-3-phosphate acyltransferase